MATKPANAAQKKWMSDITAFINEESLGILYPEYTGQYAMQRHHVLGRSAKHNKIAIGHWFVIPVPFELHDPNVTHEFHVGHCKKAFIERHGYQRGIFQCLVSCMDKWGYDTPPMDVYYAIMDTNA